MKFLKYIHHDEVEINFIIAISVNLNKCLREIKLPISLQACALISELTSNISIIVCPIYVQKKNVKPKITSFHLGHAIYQPDHKFYLCSIIFVKFSIASSRLKRFQTLSE